MSKERLESAKLMAKMLRLETRLPYDFPFDLADWLVEQAERVYEFEGKIKRYREALEFYADKENYEPEHYDPDTHNYTSLIDHDKGATARKALEGEK